jgi:hypothetical protein
MLSSDTGATLLWGAAGEGGDDAPNFCKALPKKFNTVCADGGSEVDALLES